MSEIENQGDPGPAPGAGEPPKPPEPGGSPERSPPSEPPAAGGEGATTPAPEAPPSGGGDEPTSPTPSGAGEGKPDEGRDAKPEAEGSSDAERPRKKKRRRKKKPAGAEGGQAPDGGGGPAPRKPGRSFVEDQIDRDAEKLAREARTIPSSRLRPIGIMAQEVRRMAASGSPGDAREARRALVLMKSKIAFLAGREQGRERSAFVKVRDTIFSGVDALTRQRETPDPMQLRNFLDHLEAFVGYHRFHSDDRRRD
ncbi:MAG: type III-A CRISPR-associated protein Csm2 [Planctomycetota bacterium JB042]